MTVFSIVAFTFGAFGVWLTIKENILCWPISLVAVIASVIEFYRQQLFGNMVLQVLYLFLGFYSWIYWNRKRYEYFKTKSVNPKLVFQLILLTVIQFGLYYYLLIILKGDMPLLDAFLTASSLTATFMMTKKWVENWLAWILIDTTYVFLYSIKNMWLFALLYFLFAVMAFYGWIKWKKTT